MDVKVTKHFFKYGSEKYFRGNAINVELGTYGPKHDPVGAKAYLEPTNKVRAEHLVGRVKRNPPVEIDWAQTTAADVEVNGLKYLTLNGDVEFTYNKARTARLRLVNFSIDSGPLKTVLNQEADGARKALASEGKDARIVSEVWVVADAELTQQMNMGAGATLTLGSGNSLALNLGGGQQGTERITLGRGTTFAYKLHKVKDWDNGKERIKDLEDDYKGLG